MKAYVLLVTTLVTQIILAKIPLLETPFTDYKFDANQCKVIQHNESRIFIPTHCFYLEDKLYTGEVTLKYREFRDQLDIVINKLPMAYNENGKQHTLESGGMFELFAYGNSKQLSFSKGKKITVQLASKFPIAGGETFILNRDKNIWYKDTPFGQFKESNQPINDNENLWGDYIPGRNDDAIFFRNSNVVVDNNGNNWLVREQTFKTIQVDKMELYNCDRILDENTIPIIAEFKVNGTNQLLNSEIFIVYKNRNAVLSYLPSQFKSDIKLLPNEEFTIFSIDKDGKVAVVDAQFMQSFNSSDYINKKVVFPMKVYSKLPTTKSELAAITGI